MSGGMKNIVLMGSAMMAFRRLDQEDPEVIKYTRLLFAAYIALCAVINFVLHRLVVARSDQTPVVVPPQTPSPFAPPPPEGVDASRDTTMTTLQYDLGVAASARKSWMMNVVMLSLIHAKTGAVNPLLMSTVMGLARFVDDPLVQLYVMRSPATGTLKRPFKPEANPLASALQNMLPKLPEAGDDADDQKDSDANGNGTRPQHGQVGNGRSVTSPVEIEELHDDGDDEDEDDGEIKGIGQDDDNPEDNDFADEDNTEPKKSR